MTSWDILLVGVLWLHWPGQHHWKHTSWSVHAMSKAKAGRGGNTPTKLEFTPPPPHPK